jgi:hypothetical protein
LPLSHSSLNSVATSANRQRRVDGDPGGAQRSFIKDGTMGER